MESFNDRRGQLFGREAEVRTLLERAEFRGVTTISAPPLMGKTWVLSELARRLTESEKYLVGYHESKGQESSHLLHAVSDLYARWLTHSSMREQALSLWERHKGNLVPRIGVMIGSLFENISAIAPAKVVAKLVHTAFDTLTDAQKDLLSGGVELSPLAYDQAVSLATLVADISNLRIVFILDAWELSPSKLAEFATIQAFLRHLDQWPHTHIYLAVRNPDIRSAQSSEEAFRLASELCGISAAASVHELSHMDLDTDGEGSRLVEYLRNLVPAVSNVSEQDILDLVAGYPGVVDFWTTDPARSTMLNYQDLRKQAVNAHKTQYTELDRLLIGLGVQECEFAALLALFPRLSAERWSAYRRFLVNKKWKSSFHALVNGQVLIDANHPTYGHDTRHEAARQWFLLNRKPLMRRLAVELVESMVSRVTGLDANSHRICEALGALATTARDINLDAELRALIVAAQLIRGDPAGTVGPELDDAYVEAAALNSAAVGLIGRALVNRGVRKGIAGDRAGAKADFAAAMTLRNAPADVIATARFNIAVLRQEEGDIEGAAAEYIKVIRSRNAPVRAVAGALINRATAKWKSDDIKSAIAGYTAAIRLPGAPQDCVELALKGLILAAKDDENWKRVIAACTDLIERSDDWEMLEFALDQRAFARNSVGDWKGATRDCTELLESSNTSLKCKGAALLNRAAARSTGGDGVGAIEDLTALVNLDGAAPLDVVIALLNRGLERAEMGAMEDAFGDFAEVFRHPAATAEHKMRALANQATSKWHGGDVEGAFADYGEAMNVTGVPAEWTSRILIVRGIRQADSGFREEAIADFSAVIDEMPDAPAALVMDALFFRAGNLAVTGEIERAIADYLSVIASPDSSAERVAEAYSLHSYLLGMMGGCAL